MVIDLDDLIRKEREYHESIKPVDVQVLLGDRLLTVRVPYVWGDRFDEVASKYPSPYGMNGPRGPFDLDKVMREHPDVVLIDGDEQDDLYVLRDKQAVYRWSEVYDALRAEDQENLQAVIWGLHVHLPRQRFAEAVAAKEGGDDV